MIAIEHLNVIDVIHQEGSFQKASERLFKARSAVSYSVKKVEEYYQIEIFDREQYRPQLTRDGQLLINKIQNLLNAANEFDEFARQLGNEQENELRLGVSSIFDPAKLSQLLRYLQAQFPATAINLQIEISSGERLLLDEKVDIGIYGAMELNEQVVYRQIDDFCLPVLVSNKFPLPIEQLSMKQLAKFPQAVLTASYKSGKSFGILKEGRQWYMSDHNTKKALIRDGLCWGRLPSHEIQQDLEQGNLIEVPGSKTMELPAYIARLKNKSLGPVGNAVWNYFNPR